MSNIISVDNDDYFRVANTTTTDPEKFTKDTSYLASNIEDTGHDGIQLTKKAWLKTKELFTEHNAKVDVSLAAAAAEAGT